MATTTEKAIITVRAIVHAPVKKVWEFWTDPKHIIHWNYASDDWHAPSAENDLRVGGKFVSRMEAKDGSFGFDFSGKYSKVELHKVIAYTLDDDREVQISFDSNENETTVTETFEAEQENTPELQQTGWQAILDNFKKYVEVSGKSEKMHFEINIHASAEKVYQTMIAKKTYSEWTEVFNSTSRFEGSWEKGSKILFVGTDQNGATGGMVGKIRENIPGKFISIEYIGLVQGNIEVLSGPEVEDWIGFCENYTFAENIGTTLLSIDIDTNEEFKAFFIDTWPQALNKLKEICEK